MKVLLTGAGGQLGKELVKLREYYTPDSYEMDLRDPDRVQEKLALYKPDLIVHAAAYTDTLKPEYDADEAFQCYATNALGTRNLVMYATCPIIYISTESAIHPYNFYILTKMAGEHWVKQSKYGYKIIRTSFRHDPFEYLKACTDMWTIADSTEKIAPLIDAEVDKPVDNTLIYIGTGVKTVYDLAVSTRPDVIPATRAEVSVALPSMEELLELP